MNLSQRVNIPAQVFVRKAGEESLILDLASGTYFGLDQVGTEIWELMEQGKTLEEISDAMMAKYDVSKDGIRQDINNLVEIMQTQHLINLY